MYRQSKYQVIKKLEAKIRQGRLKWFGHLRWVKEDSTVEVAENLKVAGRKPAGRPKRTCRKCTQQDLEWLTVNEQLALDRKKSGETSSNNQPYNGIRKTDV